MKISSLVASIVSRPFLFLRCVTPFRTTMRISPMETLYILPGCHGEPGSETTDRKLWRQDGANDTSFIYSTPRASISDRGELPLDSQLPPLHTFPRLSRPHAVTRVVVLFMHSNLPQSTYSVYEHTFLESLEHWFPDVSWELSRHEVVLSNTSDFFQVLHL